MPQVRLNTKYSDEQARDDHGRWSDGGSTTSTDSSKTEAGQAVKNYVVSGYSAINQQLREQTSWPSDKATAQVAILDTAMAKQPEADVHFWRGTTGGGLTRALFVNSDKPLPDSVALNPHSSPAEFAAAEKTINDLYAGTVFTDKGFVSASASKEAGKQFRTGAISFHRNSPIGGLVEITGRSRSLDVNSFLGSHINSNESEHILPHGSVFRIDHISINHDANIYLHYQVSIQQQGKKGFKSIADKFAKSKHSDRFVWDAGQIEIYSTTKQVRL